MEKIPKNIRINSVEDCEECNNDDGQIDFDPESYQKWIDDNKQETILMFAQSSYAKHLFYYIYTHHEGVDNLNLPCLIEPKLTKPIYYKSYKKNPICLSGPLEKAGFIKTTSVTKANIIWKLYKYEEMIKVITKLKKHQKYNHFPKTFQLGRKDNLWKNYLKLNKTFSNDYNYMPLTFLIPNNYNEFKQIYKQNNYWIVKPKNSARGSGVRLLKSLSDLPKECIVSKYLDKPHLINNKKYDLRLYVLITSYSPLKIYFFRDGLVRFASEEYNKEDRDNIFVHLTNYAINKLNSKYVKNDNYDCYGSKWSLTAYKEYFNKNGLQNEYDDMFIKIKDIIIKTILTNTEDTIIITKAISKYPNNIFEVYGFDVFIDYKFRPWLLEVNVSPSLNCDSELDLKIKTQLITDAINTAGVLVETNKEKENLPFIKNKNSQSKIKISKDFDSKNPNFKLSENEIDHYYYEMFLYFEEEIKRSGSFELLFPKKENIKYYCKFIKSPFDENIMLWKWIMSNKIKPKDL
jgi:tubulin polyglutamylase TTLL4